VEQRGTDSLCGNGVLNIREECDDGNDQDGDGCDKRCRREVLAQTQECGNGFLDGNEQCETTSPCPRPGDECRNCQCFVPAGPVCGNGVLESPEQCETTTPCQDATFICSRCTCLAPVCGDGARTQGEECDDGNSTDGDGCSGGCRIEPPSFIASQELCGNGIVEEGEQCDDGNQMDQDGCSAACTVEHFAVPAGSPDVAGLSLIVERPPEADMSSSVPTLVPARTGPTPKKAPALSAPTPATGVRPQMRPAASPSAPATFPTTTTFPLAATTTQQMVPQYPAYWQPYDSGAPFAPISGPVGKTGPASLAIMVSGAAAGFAFMRRQKRSN